MSQKSLSQDPTNILLCQQRQIGDVILSTPLISLIAKRFPDANIHFFTEKKCAPILENNPCIKKVWVLDKKKYTNLLVELFFYKQIANTKYDIVIDCQQLPRIRWIVAMSRAPIRLGITKRWYSKFLYTAYAKKPDTEVYATALKATILHPLGLQWSGERPEIYLTEDELAQARTLFASMGVTQRPVISVDVTHKRETSCWPAKNYAALLDLLAEKYPSFLFFLPYGPGEKEKILEVQALSLFPEKILIPDEVISLRLMAACIKHCVLHIGNCSAPRHLAVAVGTPSFTILGATGESWTFPSAEHKAISLGLPCQPCQIVTCGKDYTCLYQLLPEKVFQKISEHMTFLNVL